MIIISRQGSEGCARAWRTSGLHVLWSNGDGTDDPWWPTLEACRSQTRPVHISTSPIMHSGPETCVRVQIGRTWGVRAKQTPPRAPRAALACLRACLLRNLSQGLVCWLVQHFVPRAISSARFFSRSLEMSVHLCTSSRGATQLCNSAARVPLPCGLCSALRLILAAAELATSGALLVLSVVVSLKVSSDRKWEVARSVDARRTHTKDEAPSSSSSPSWYGIHDMVSALLQPGNKGLPVRPGQTNG